MNAEEKLKHGEQIREKIAYWLNQGVSPKIMMEITGITRSQYRNHVQILRAEGKINRDFRFKK